VEIYENGFHLEVFDPVTNESKGLITVSVNQTDKTKIYDEIMGATDWLRNVYGLNDDDTLTAAEVEELLEHYKATREKEILSHYKSRLIAKLEEEKDANPHSDYDLGINDAIKIIEKELL
jgi:hypothetical protein